MVTSYVLLHVFVFVEKRNEGLDTRIVVIIVVPVVILVVFITAAVFLFVKRK